MLQSAYAPENHSPITLPCVYSCFIMCCICNAEVSHIQIECKKTKAESTMRPSSNLLLSLLRVYLRFHLLMLLLRLMLLLLSCTSNLEGLISPNTQQMGPIKGQVEFTLSRKIRMRNASRSKPFKPLFGTHVYLYIVSIEARTL